MVFGNWLFVRWNAREGLKRTLFRPNSIERKISTGSIMELGVPNSKALGYAIAAMDMYIVRTPVSLEVY